MNCLIVAAATAVLVAGSAPVMADHSFKPCRYFADDDPPPATAEEVVALQLPARKDGSFYTGDGTVFVKNIVPERARTGGSASRVLQCDHYTLMYNIMFDENGVGALPLGKDGQVVVVVHAGGMFSLRALITAETVEASLLVTAETKIFE